MTLRLWKRAVTSLAAVLYLTGVAMPASVTPAAVQM